MTRSLAPSLADQVASSGTLPGYFVEVLFDPPLWVCSRGTIAWGGVTWVKHDVRVSGIDHDAGRASQEGTIVFGNADLAIGAQLLSQGIADREVNVWKFYGDAPEEEDAVQIFSGVGDNCDIDADAGTATISVVIAGSRTLYCPRRRITADQDFSLRPAAGTIIPWNGENFVLEGRG